MKNTFKKFLLAAAIIAAPAAASALTVTGASGGSTCEGKFQSSAWQVDALAGAHVNATFVAGDLAGTQCFDLRNTSLSDAIVSVTVATVNQGGDAWGWLGGITLDTKNGGVVTSDSVAQGSSWLKEFNFIIAAGSAVLFDWTYGDTYVTGTSNDAVPQFDFTISATVVPIPAAGFLLLGALGGLGFAGRRRRKAA